jgi:histidinol-phosphate aminotransferase
MAFDFTVRKEVNDCLPYIQGETIDDVKERYNLSKVIKLGSNENPYGPFPHALAAMKDSLVTLNRYPENDFINLKKLLAKKNDVQLENIILGSGAGNVLEILAKTFLNTGDEVIIAKQSYRLYREISKIMGAKVIEIPLTEDYQFDLSKFLSVITSKTKLIWLCNPNNPTSTLTDKHAINKFVEKLPSHVQLIIDEAYADFSNPDDRPDVIDYVKNGKKVIIVRTFSKYYGLAGARMGYAIANKDTVQAYDTVTEPFSASRIALAGSYASMTLDKEEVAVSRQKIIEQRDKLTVELEKLGCKTAKSQANFIFTQIPFEATWFCDEMMKRGVIIRDCTPWNYPYHVRITIGTPAENENFLKTFCSLLEEKKVK